MPINISQTPIYESYSMLHPDGSLMCYCNFKRASWYIKRNLAQWINEKSFKLNFVPQGHGKADEPYYVQSLQNRCVICGATGKLNKHHVVPYVFRSRFPTQYKESNHHDVLPTCVDCHEKYEEHATDYKKQLAQDCGVSINSSLSANEQYNKKILSAQKLLEKLKEKDNQIKIPLERLQVLQKTAQLPLIAVEKTSGTAWADKIMEKTLNEGQLWFFIKKWRQHFIKYAQPQFLPAHWSIEYPLEKIGNKTNS